MIQHTCLTGVFDSERHTGTVPSCADRTDPGRQGLSPTYASLSLARERETPYRDLLSLYSREIGREERGL
jgi:hypothetical protein